VEVPYFLSQYDPDALRFCLTATAPETRDTPMAVLADELHKKPGCSPERDQPGFGTVGRGVKGYTSIPFSPLIL
jgi:hypothetical protein